MFIDGNRRVLISGCSGGGKSTLLLELAARGFAIVPEPGRRIVKAELEAGGGALPWLDLAAFARRAIDMAMADHAAASARPGWTFFDRGLVDAACALSHATAEPPEAAALAAHRYHRQVFMAPPWPEIYGADAERQHGLMDAIAEYDRLAALLPALGYEMVLLPKRAVEERADFILQRLGASS
ncbi:AAA family ATPase [Devosia sp.]|uniref:AAA family ATPase n=1 Tax=Devosia sp. TaxID=1871048 RepID=UPI002AFDF1A8|nr:AAA family ATPase [Devosia sp.]